MMDGQAQFQFQQTDMALVSGEEVERLIAGLKTTPSWTCVRPKRINLFQREIERRRGRTDDMHRASLFLQGPSRHGRRLAMDRPRVGPPRRSSGPPRSRPGPAGLARRRPEQTGHRLGETHQRPGLCRPVKIPGCSPVRPIPTSSFLCLQTLNTAPFSPLSPAIAHIVKLLWFTSAVARLDHPHCEFLPSAHTINDHMYYKVRVQSSDAHRFVPP
jgi:hypothetical protein